MKLRSIAAALALLGALPASAFGQTTELPAVVVTATRSQTRASAVLSDISVITREEIAQAGQSTVAELLHAQAGLQTWATGGRGSSSSISIRGGSPQQTLVLIDGQRMSSSTLGTTAIENIPLNQIERIEILRGPASALYGADAIGGVVQIFTRKGDGAPRLSAEAGAGSYRTASGMLNYGGRAGDTSFNINAGYIDSDSFSATKPGAFGFNPDRDPYANRNLSAQVAQRLGADHELGANVFYSDGKTRFDAANCDPAFIVCTNDFDNYQTQALSSYSLYSRNRLVPNWTSQVRIGRGEDNLASYSLDPVAGSVGSQKFRTVQDQLTWQNDIATSRGTILLAAERRKEAVDSNAIDFTVAQRTTTSLVAGYHASLDAHSLQLSARHDRISQFGSPNTGSLAYGYQLTPALRASASISTAFRAPTFDDLFWPVDFNSFYVGNPNLRPERARNKEAGLVYESAGRRASLTAFHNRVSDLIAFGDAAAPPFFITTINVGSAVLKGATASYSDTFGNWKLRTSYDALSARNADTGLFLIRRAKQRGTAELRYGDSQWDGGVQLVATGARYNDTANTQKMGGFTLVNLDTRYALDRDWSLFARLNNAFAKRYELVRGFNTSGANLFVGVRYAPK